MEMTAEQKKALALARARAKAASQASPPATMTPDGRSVAPGTTQADAENIPQGMVFDPETGGYFDAANAARRQDTSMRRVGGFMANAAAGVPFAGEFADEATGGINSVMTGQSPEIGQEYARQLAGQYAEDNPKSALAARVGGGVAGALGIGGQIAKSAPAFVRWAGSLIPGSTTGKVVAGAAAGAVSGGIEGSVAGLGAGTTPDTRRAKAQEYGAYGTIGGAIAGGVTPLAVKGVKAIGETLMDNWSRVSKSIPGLSPQAAGELREAVGADMAVGNVTANMRRAGPNAMVADAGQATADLLDSAVSMSQRGGAAAADRINSRASGSLRTLNQTFDNTMGGPQGIMTLNKAVDDAAKPGIKAAYKQAYSTPIDYATGGPGEVVLDVLGKIPDRIKQPALRLAREMMEFDEIPPQFMISIDDAGNASVSRMPGVAELDYVKRALDSIAEDSRNSIGKLSSEGRMAAGYARRLRNSVRDAVPVYGEALDNASDAFGLQKAIKFGDDILKRDIKPDFVDDWVKKALPVEKQAAVSGLRANIAATLDDVKRTLGNPDVDVQQVKAAVRNLSSPASRRKMISLLGRNNAKQVFKALDEAGAAIELQGNVARNSRTAPRLARDARIRERQDFSTAQIGREAASGGVLSAPRKLAQISAGNTPMARAAETEKLYLEIAEYLTGARGQAAIAQADALVKAAQNSPIQAQKLQQLGQNAAKAIGLPLYQLQEQSQRTGPR